jgi:hypothetical protein
MSVHLITVIPTDPFWVPDEAHEAAATALIDELLTDRQGLDVRRHEPPQYFDAGEYQQGAYCPFCSSSVDDDFWRSAIIRVIDGDDFGPLDIVLPCCGVAASLNDVASDPPEGFASWSVCATNPDEGCLSADDQACIEVALGHPVRIVLTRY